MDKKILRHIGITLVAASALVMIHTDARAAILCAKLGWSTDCGSMRNPEDRNARVWGVHCYNHSETCKEGVAVNFDTPLHSRLRDQMGKICANPNCAD